LASPDAGTDDPPIYSRAPFSQSAPPRLVPNRKSPRLISVFGVRRLDAAFPSLHCRGACPACSEGFYKGSVAEGSGAHVVCARSREPALSEAEWESLCVLRASAFSSLLVMEPALLALKGSMKGAKSKGAQRRIYAPTAPRQEP